MEENSKQNIIIQRIGQFDFQVKDEITGIAEFVKISREDNEFEINKKIEEAKKILFSKRK